MAARGSIWPCIWASALLFQAFVGALPDDKCASTQAPIAKDKWHTVPWEEPLDGKTCLYVFGTPKELEAGTTIIIHGRATRGKVTVFAGMSSDVTAVHEGAMTLDATKYADHFEIKLNATSKMYIGIKPSANARWEVKYTIGECMPARTFLSEGVASSIPFMPGERQCYYIFEMPEEVPDNTIVAIHARATNGRAIISAGTYSDVDKRSITSKVLVSTDAFRDDPLHITVSRASKVYIGVKLANLDSSCRIKYTTAASSTTSPHLRTTSTGAKVLRVTQKYAESPSSNSIADTIRNNAMLLIIIMILVALCLTGLVVALIVYLANTINHKKLIRRNSDGGVTTTALGRSGRARQQHVDSITAQAATQDQQQPLKLDTGVDHTVVKGHVAGAETDLEPVTQPREGHATTAEPREGHATTAEPLPHDATVTEPRADGVVVTKPLPDGVTAAEPRADGVTATEPRADRVTATQPRDGHATTAEPQADDAIVTQHRADSDTVEVVDQGERIPSSAAAVIPTRIYNDT